MYLEVTNSKRYQLHCCVTQYTILRDHNLIHGPHIFFKMGLRTHIYRKFSVCCWVKKASCGMHTWTDPSHSYLVNLKTVVKTGYRHGDWHHAAHGNTGTLGDYNQSTQTFPGYHALCEVLSAQHPWSNRVLGHGGRWYSTTPPKRISYNGMDHYSGNAETPADGADTITGV